MSSEYVSKEKLEALKKELEYLKTDRRKELAEALQKARGLGDLSENAEYHNAREEQGFAEDRIRQLEEIVKNAKVIDETNKKKGVVDIGSVVVIRKKGEKKDKTVEIVGGEESDFLNGKISYKSPLGQALLGQVVDETVKFTTPKGEVVYKIISIS